MKFIDVADPTRELALGERGEICVKGPNVMRGYWKKPDATAEAMTADGFLRTGDVGYMDEDGFVFIVDRTKDMLLVGGFNVYPRNIEEAIYKHPSVEEVERDRRAGRLSRRDPEGLRKAQGRRSRRSRWTN